MRESTHAESNVHVYTWAVDRLANNIPQWPSLSAEKRAKIVKGFEPDSEFHTHNVTCVGLHERHTAELDPEDSGSGSITHLAFGDDSTEPGTSNRELNNEIDRYELTDLTREGTSIRTLTFLDSGMANGENILECGLVSTNDPSNSNDKLWNHSLLSDPEGRLEPKTSDVVARIVVTLSWGDGA